MIIRYLDPRKKIKIPWAIVRTEGNDSQSQAASPRVGRALDLPNQALPSPQLIWLVLDASNCQIFYNE
jgi:hypothetical protein